MTAPVPADQEEALVRKAMNRARLEASSRMDLPDGRTRYEPGFPEQTLYGQLAAAIATLRAERDQLASELREARGEDWQPISTAPPGHGLVWLFEPHCVGGFQFVGCRNMDGAWGNNLDCRRQNPTHWRPLAKPPAFSDPRPSPAKGDDHHG